VGHDSSEYHSERSPRSWDAALGALARRQYGIVAAWQLHELGVPRHAVQARVRAKRWCVLHRGVWAVGHDALTWRGHLLAAVYACSPGSLASHRAAGALHGLLRSSRIEVTTSRGRRPRSGMTIHRSRLIGEDDRAVVDGIPVTSVARTLVDLADVLTDERLEKAIHQAEILGLFDLDALERASQPGRRGAHRLTRVLASYAPETHLIRSKAEAKLKRLCKAHALPRPQFNVQVHGHEADVYWPEAALILEFDGAATHRTTHAFHADRRRDRALAAEGVQSIRVTWPDLNAALMDELREILRRR
jgi:very-short-patch-repair endonuclease